jgi:hypothetical protein
MIDSGNDERATSASIQLHLLSRLQSASAAIPSVRNADIGSLTATFLRACLSDDRVGFYTAKPEQRQIVTRSRNRYSTVGTAPTLVDRALSDDFDKEDIGFRRPDASKRSRAVEVRIRCLCPSGADDELEFIGRLAADLGELTAPISDD